jgi:hypothetical protein
MFYNSCQYFICHCRQTCISVSYLYSRGISRCCLVYVFAMVDHCVLSDPLCRRNVSDERLVGIDCGVCWIKYCIFNLLHGIQITFTPFIYG